MYDHNTILTYSMYITKNIGQIEFYRIINYIVVFFYLKIFLIIIRSFLKILPSYEH